MVRLRLLGLTRGYWPPRWTQRFTNSSAFSSRMSSISSSRLSSSSLIFLPFLDRSALPAPASSPPPSLGLVGLVSFFFCSAIGRHLLAPRSRDRSQGLDGREHDPLLALILPLPVSI